MYHIKDEEFVRAKVPMTKEEVRAISIAKMDIRDSDICIDIGGGTGSVSIEMSMFAKNGYIYTIEQKEEAVDLIKQNMEKFDVKNMTLIKKYMKVICIFALKIMQLFIAEYSTSKKVGLWTYKK